MEETGEEVTGWRVSRSEEVTFEPDLNEVKERAMLDNWERPWRSRQRLQ